MTIGLARATPLRGQSTAADIMEKLGSALDTFNIFHNQVLVAIFIRPEKTAGGIFLADQTIGEDVYQGKCGLVLKKGPLAFKNDERNDFGGCDVEVGDWAVFRVSDGFSLKINGVMCRLLEDVHVKAVTPDPLTVY